MESITEHLDLTPDPRILPMLGEINFDQWQCLAELIDNPIDAFLSAHRAAQPLSKAAVHISLPTTDSPTAQVTIRGTGPGMDILTLNNAVRAGWTSHNSMDHLGLFGMGFNIATARLGSKTRVVSARAGDPDGSASRSISSSFKLSGRSRRLASPNQKPIRPSTARGS